jgi:hypothetical protein
MEVIKQIAKHHLSVVAVHKLGKIFLLFTSDSIYIYGEEKEVIKFHKLNTELAKH